LNTLHSTYHIQQKHYQNGRALFKIAITLPDPIPEGQKLSLNLNQAGLEIHHNQYYNFEKNKVQALLN
ncbi:hypothetical protein, partial [Mesomycoplasma ovipneumoniae]|uniref:hypothetical protein n=1 Tax=Mesomycoplasma ovipneumoniae TaxID=29562 RepID=UPI00311A0797